MAFKATLRNPTIQEYNDLRHSAGWPVMRQDLVEIGLSNTIHAVVVQDENHYAVGMGRIIGDGAIYFHIQDVIVRPEFQKQRIGKLIMDELLKYLEDAGGPNTNIGLMCSKGREEFYKGFGFIERPTDKFGAGMIKIKS